ncbi:MAG TPA: hypothetical protein PKD61_03085 [Polyangiaceae bacterium]|nr:hypothetical protein [Polyangiaceae bacterium]
MRIPVLAAAVLTVAVLTVACQTKTPSASKPSAGPITSVAAPRAEPASGAADPEQAKLVAKNPEGLQFRIRLPDGSRYRQGERIRVELSFASSRAEAYKLDGGLYDRAGRMHVDRFVVSPGDTRDPLADYFASGIGGMGGLRSMPVLTEKPHVMVFDLNEWHRFDRPGRYRLYVTSGRVSWEEDASDGGIVQENSTVTSQNVVAFHVVPADGAWRKRTLNEAKMVLDDAKTTEEKKREAARTLRFFGTETAAREMIRRLPSDAHSFEFSFGLYGSVHRSLIVAEMEASLVRPDYPVTDAFLRTLSLLKAWTQFPANGADAGAGLWKVRNAKRQQIEDELAARLASSLAKKVLAARAVSTATLLSVGRSRAHSGSPPKWLSAAHSTLPSVLARLPSAELSNLLSHGFGPIAHLPLTKALKDLLTQKELEPNLRRLALGRLHELDPVEGRKRILEIIRRGEPDLGILPMDTLGALPDKALPQVEPDLAARLERCAPHCHPNELWIVGSLIQRYGSRAIAPRVRAAYEKHQDWGAREQAVFLAYFLRVDPAYGAKAVQAAVKRRGSLSSVELCAKTIALQPSQQVEAVLIAELENSVPHLAGEAARALGRYGSAKAEAALWARLERWSKQWRGKEKQLRHPLIGENPNSEQIQLERALWGAIASGQAWLTDLKGLQKLHALLVTEQEKQQLAYKFGEWKQGIFAIRWHRQTDGNIRVSLAQFELDSLQALEAKLAQFPQGSRFSWQPYAEAKGDFEAVKRTVTAHGSRLSR